MLPRNLLINLLNLLKWLKRKLNNIQIILRILNKILKTLDCFMEKIIVINLRNFFKE